MTAEGAVSGSPGSDDADRGQPAPPAVSPPLADPLASALAAGGQPMPTDEGSGPDAGGGQGSGDADPDAGQSSFDREFDDPLDRLGASGPDADTADERLGGSPEQRRGFDDRLDEGAAMEGQGPTG